MTLWVPNSASIGHNWPAPAAETNTAMPRPNSQAASEWRLSITSKPIRPMAAIPKSTGSAGTNASQLRKVEGQSRGGVSSPPYGTYIPMCVTQSCSQNRLTPRPIALANNRLMCQTRRISRNTQTWYSSDNGNATTIRSGWAYQQMAAETVITSHSNGPGEWPKRNSHAR